MARAAISRSASTVGLSFDSLLSSCGSTPLASWRARLAAIITSSKRLSTTCRQSSTVIRAMGYPAALGRLSVQGGPAILSAPGSLRNGACANPPLGEAGAPPGAGACPGRRSDALVRQQGRDQPAVARHLPFTAQPAGSEDRAHLVDRGGEVLVD